MPRKPLATKAEPIGGTPRQVCQGVPATNGNIEHSSHAKYKYSVVINNYTELEKEIFCASVRQICKKAVVGCEVGESGTPHLQCQVSLKVKARMDTLHKIPGWERSALTETRNEAESAVYCRKDGKVIIDFGYPKPPKIPTIITVLRPWQRMIEMIFEMEPNDRTIHWFWEGKGNIGKSAFVKYMVVKHKALFCDGGKKSDIINLVFNNNMDECKCVIWDLPRSTKGSVSYSSLEAIKNGMICNTKYETGVKVFDPPHIFVFANYPPDKPDELSSDRWNINEIL
nr:MAG: replication associated protein [Cressdnaviricota sp.]